MDTIITILQVLAVWALVSIPAGIFFGKFCALQNKAPRSK